MNCTDFRSAINDALDSRRPLRTDAAAHLGECRDAACRQAWDDALLLERAIDSWRSARPAVDVVQAVLSGCRLRDPAVRPGVARLPTGSVPAARPESASQRAATAVAVAAAALLVLLLLLPAGADRPASAPLSVAASHRPATDISLTYVTYAQNAAQIVTDAVVLTLGGSEQMEASRVTPPGIGWEADWPPLGDVHAALDDLLQSLPAEPPQS